ncbi:MAG: hypothetical protein KA004_10755 [Verrucomicrobiales bacterium]|nr:hypothetical protein [Verrucomicrobiales bacterium]
MGRYLNSRSNRFFHCGVCAAEVKRGALACPDCGADRRTGLFGFDGAEGDLPETQEDFDYDAFIKREFGRSPRPAGLHLVWWIAGVLLFAALVVGALSGWL